MEVCPAADNLEHMGVVTITGSKQTHLFLNGCLGNMFSILPILNEVGPPRTSFRVIDATTLEFHTEICINGEESHVQPPRKNFDH